MKTISHMLRLISLMSLTCLLAIGFQSCYKCHDTNLGLFKLSNSERQLIPYTPKSRLVFKSSATDSTIFVTDSITNLTGTDVVPFTGNNYGDCQTYYNYETCSVYCSDSTSRNWISLSLSYLSVSSVALFVGISYVFNDTTLRFIAHSFVSNDSIYGKYYPNLTIGGKTFENVHEIEAPGYDLYESLQFVYYTQKLGIVGFKSFHDRVWYLSSS